MFLFFNKIELNDVCTQAENLFIAQYAHINTKMKYFVSNNKQTHTNNNLIFIRYATKAVFRNVAF